MKFHSRSWDGRFWAYVYAGPLRVTIFKSSWLFGKRKNRSILAWTFYYLSRTFMIGAFLGLPSWLTYHNPYWILNILTSVARRLH